MCWAHSGPSGKLLGIHWESQESTGSPLGTVAEWKLLVSAGFKAWTMFSMASESKAAEHILDAEALMQFAIEEWDRQAPM